MDEEQSWISKLTNGAFSAGMIWVLAMMALTVVDVIGRYVFSRPVPGSIELSEFMLALFGMLGMGYTERMNANVRVVILEKVLSPRLISFLKVSVYLLSAGVIACVAYQGVATAIEEYHYKTASDNLGIPVYPFYFLLSLSSGILVLVLLDKVKREFLQLFKIGKNTVRGI